MFTQYSTFQLSESGGCWLNLLGIWGIDLDIYKHNLAYSKLTQVVWCTCNARFKFYYTSQIYRPFKYRPSSTMTSYEIIIHCKTLSCTVYFNLVEFVFPDMYFWLTYNRIIHSYPAQIYQFWSRIPLKFNYANPAEN